MGIEGRLQLTLKLDKGGVDGVTIESSRPVHAAAVLHSKTVAEAQKMVPLLFSVCGTAQACAAARALEQAKGMPVDASADQLRETLVDLETLREHMWCVLLDWPGFVGGSPVREAMAEVVALQHQFTQALCQGGDAFAFGGLACRSDREVLAGIRNRLLELLARRVYGVVVEDWLSLPDYPALRDWVDRYDTPATALLQKVMAQTWQQAGDCQSDVLPVLNDREIAQAMLDYHYVERPQWQGECRETTSLGRVDSALLRELTRECGNGLLTRLVARLHEIAQLALKLVPQDGQVRHSRPAAGADVGVGQVAAARGQLVHRVELDPYDRVADYRILAPTEWNFHPAGVVSRALAVLRGSAEQIEQQARLLITAIDPCVGYELRMVGNG